MLSALTRRLAAQPLGRQLGMAVVLSLVPALGLVAWTSVATLQERSEGIADEAQVIALTTAAYVNCSFADVEGMAQAVTRAPFVQAMDAEQSQEMIERLVLTRLDVIGIQLVSAAGDTVTSLSPSDSADLPRAGLQGVLAGGERVVAALEGPGRVQAVA